MRNVKLYTLFMNYDLSYTETSLKSLETVTKIRMTLSNFLKTVTFSNDGCVLWRFAVAAVCFGKQLVSSINSLGSQHLLRS